MTKQRAWLVGVCAVALTGCGSIERLPVANAGDDQLVEPETAVSLDGTASEGRSLDFEWNQVAGPDVTLDLSNPGQPQFSAPAGRATLTFELVVMNDLGASQPDTITVEVNTAPVANAGGSRDVMSARTVYLDPGASRDADGDVLTYKWTQTGGVDVALDTSHPVVATFRSPGEPTELTFELEVCDQLGCSTDDAQIHVHTWTQVDAGWYHTRLRRSDGTLWVVGEDNGGTLGIGARAAGDHVGYVVQVPLPGPVETFQAGIYSTVAKLEDGSVYAMGRNCSSEVGVAVVSSCDYLSPPVMVQSAFQSNDGSPFAQYSAAGDYGFFRFENGVMGGTGSNAPTICAGPGGSSDLEPIAGSWDFVSASAGTSGVFAFAIDSVGDLYSWGDNADGQLGRGTEADGCHSDVVKVGTYKYKVVKAGTDHTVAIRDSGLLYSWGDREVPEGDIANTSPTSNHRGTETDWLDVDAGWDFSVALRGNGQIHAWGENSDGQLGLGHQTDTFFARNATPPRIGNDSDWVAIAAGLDYAVALKQDGSAWSWGNGYFPLGLGGDGFEAMLSPTRMVDGAPTCGDGITVRDHGQRPTFIFDDVFEACDDGAFNGSPGACSATCKCTNTNVIYVDADATGAGDGSSWANAFTTLQPAVNAANSCTTVWVAEGVYTATSDDATLPVVQLPAGIEIFGGFAGHEKVMSQRDPIAHPTVLDGQDAHFHVVVADVGVWMDGFTITGGNASGSEPELNSGGGLFVDSAGSEELVLSNMVFRDNSANKFGGAVFIRGKDGSNRAAPRILSSRFEQNSAASGGAVWLDEANGEVWGSTFVGNTANSGAAIDGQGGAIFIGSTGGSTRIKNSAFMDNEANNDASAIFADNINSRLVGCTVVDNKGNASEAVGTSITVRNSIVVNPDLGADLTGASVFYTCYPGGGNPDGNNNYAPSGDVVVREDTPWGPRVYLHQDSNCVDTADPYQAYSTLLDWPQRSTRQDGGLDEGEPDPGIHY